MIIGSGTVSAGEAVAIAFRGRAQTRFFGSPTAGATNAPQVFRLSDGAVLWFGVMYEVDRNGRAYKGPIRPDMSFDEGSPKKAERAATRWLLAQPSCEAVG